MRIFLHDTKRKIMHSPLQLPMINVESEYLKKTLRIVCFLSYILSLPLNLIIAQSEYGIGGMSKVDNWPEKSSSAYLVVHDHKFMKDIPTDSIKDIDKERKRLKNLKFNKEKRFGLMVIPSPEKSDDKAYYKEIVEKWPHGFDKANDLEAISAIPNREDEFIAVESSYITIEDKEPIFGRLFHISLNQTTNGWELDIKVIAQLPKGTKDVEGVLCIASNLENEFHIVLGTRNSSFNKKSIRWGRIFLDTVPTIQLKLNEGVDFTENISERLPRSISDLYVDKTGRLWISSTYDIEQDQGPFKSAIFFVGNVSTDKSSLTIKMLPTPIKLITLPTLKVEALCSPVSGEAVLSYGTDDELYGGIIREIFW